MTESVANVRYRWRMGVEARALTLLTAILLTFGLATVYSASALTQDYSHNAAFFIRQATGILAGLIIFAIAAKVDAERWAKLAWPVMIISLALLAFIILPFTERFAPRVLGARRYLFGSSMQPSEIAKLAVVLWTSMLIVKKGTSMRRVSKGLFPFLVVIGIMDLLVVLEPDLSSALFYTLILGIILFASGVRIGHFVVMGIIAVPLLYTKAQKLQYVLLRMTSFFNPGAVSAAIDYQSQQSLIAIGSGGLLGVGFGNGRQQYGFLPLAYDDFIAGTIGEEWGFIGITAIVLAFTLYAWLGFRIAKQARTQFQQLVAVGLTTTTVITAFLHIGVAIHLLPNTGITLPFISYGRSNLLLTLLMTGIIVNIGSEREKVIGASATNPLAPVAA